MTTDPRANTDRLHNQVPAQDDVREARELFQHVFNSYDKPDRRKVLDLIDRLIRTVTQPSVEVVEKIKAMRDEHHDSMVDYARMDNARDSEIQEAKVSALDEALAMLTAVTPQPKEGADVLPALR